MSTVLEIARWVVLGIFALMLVVAGFGAVVNAVDAHANLPTPFLPALLGLLLADIAISVGRDRRSA